jgi:hypothetical protein
MTSQALRDFKARPADLFLYTQQQLMPETYQVESHQVLGKCALMGRLSLSPFDLPRNSSAPKKNVFTQKENEEEWPKKGHDTLELTFNDSARRHNFTEALELFTRQQISMETVRVLCCGIFYTTAVCGSGEFSGTSWKVPRWIGDYIGNCIYLVLMQDALKDIKNDFFHE